MKKLVGVFLVVFALLSLSVASLLVAARQQEDGGGWPAVREAMSQRRPQTAIDHLEPIIRSTMQTEDYDEATKAIALKIMLESSIEGGKAEERITRLQERIGELPEPMRPMMEVVLANWYWHFFQQNRWRFLQRTETTEVPGDDILTWSLPRILAEIDAHFQAALEAESWLKQTPVSEFDELLTKGTMPDTHRPTLFDFVVYEALRFYQAGEQAGAAAQDAFVLQADSPVLGSPSEFLAWEVEATDTESPTVKAIELYKKLLRFHQASENQVALAEADLSRLKFGYNQSFGPEKGARYRAALQGYVKHWEDRPIMARALAAHAEVLRGEQRLSEAHQLAQRGWKAFPESEGGKLCFNLIQQIEAREINVTIERVWTNPWPSIHVRYRNLTKVHFRAVPYDWQQLLQRANYYPGNIDQTLRDELRRAEAALEWSRDLEPTEDYLENQERFEVPDELAPGFYFLLASSDPQFSGEDNRVLAQEFWVSRLALVVRSGRHSGKLSGMVLDADTGQPVAQARVRAWLRQRVVRQYRWREQRTVRTDREGQFEIDVPENQSYALLVEHEGHALSTRSHIRTYGRHSRYRSYERTVFFTDRSLYRPGQTIRFKGICISVDPERDNYETRAHRPVTVVFEDANRQEIARRQLRTNDYGSLSGSFTAPRDRLTGRMTLRTEEDRGSRVYVNVEEYKRPKFKVELESPGEAPRLGETIRVPGTAKAYTGAAIGEAKVQYRVVREVRYPIWWHWRCWWNPPQAGAQEIAHGTTTTAPDGTFEVPFTARPDPSVSEKDEPTFRFTVHADVTDISGETRSDQRTINIGYTALRASLSADPWLTDDQPVELRVNVESLDGQPRPAQGTVRIHTLQQPARVHRAPLLNHPRFRPGPQGSGDEQPEPDLSDPNAWPLGEVVASWEFAVDAGGTGRHEFELPAGAYRAVLESEDPSGKEISAILPLQVLDPDARRLNIKVPSLVAAPQWSLEPGETFTALWGTGYEQGRAYIAIEHRGEVLQSYWTRPGATQATVEQTVTEQMRGGFTLRVFQVRENRSYVTSRRVEVPWSNKELTVKWERFVSKLKPGQQQTWTAVITGPDAEAAVAEMVATLYDASLDAYLPHNWANLDVFRRDRSGVSLQLQNMALQLQNIDGFFRQASKSVSITFRSLPPELTSTPSRRLMQRGRAFGGGMAPGAAVANGVAEGRALGEAAEAEGAPAPRGAEGAPAAMAADKAAGMRGTGAEPGGQPSIDLSKVTARKNLNETAFFFPHLKSDEDGQVRLSFTMPEALTEWKFMGLAHDQRLRSGLLTDSAVTAKDLMVEPMAPRFVREGDILEFTVKVTNQSPTRQTGTVRLSLSDARTLDPLDQQLGNAQTDRSFDIASKQSESFSWRLEIPDGMGFLIYKAVGSTGRLSDGQEGYLPVLPRRVLVTESLPLPIRDAGTKQFEFTKLLNAGDSDTLRHQALTVQMVSNPSWYAVMALPYLMEYPYECSEQVFNRLYASQLAQHIANADPKIRRIFDQWKGTEALDSPLEQNEELKSIILEETPWVRQAKQESQARRDVGVLFDANRLAQEAAHTLRKLSELQAADGSWPWFPGGRPNDYITLYITTGFGRLRHLGVDLDVAPAVKSLTRLDTWMDERYREILERGQEDNNHLSYTVAFYLYGRSFFLDDQPIAPKHKEALEYFLEQGRKYWTQLNCRQSEAHVALALKRFGDRQVPRDIMISLKERSVTDEEMGMYWRDTEFSWWWYRAPIETQAMMIEAFDEVTNDVEAVKECRVWLLKQKQTRDWKTTKATADAVYALLLRGEDLLASDQLVEVSLGEVDIEPEDVEAGTGFYEERFTRKEIEPSMGQISVTKRDEGVAWGSVHWQYLEDMSEITPHAQTPLTLNKRLYVKVNTKEGPKLRAVEGPLSVGDELVVRLELRVDRDMEYVHLKDRRGSGLEPVNVLSRYRYQDGLAYYESTRDTASHFFIDYLPKGTYVFEYSTRVVHRGQYQSGMAEIQCMYAPEFNSHSESMLITVE